MDLFDKTRSFVAENIGTGFHRRRIRKLKKAQLTKLLSKGNPLLMRAQAIETAKPIVKELLADQPSCTPKPVVAAAT